MKFTRLTTRIEKISDGSEPRILIITVKIKPVEMFTRFTNKLNARVIIHV